MRTPESVRREQRMVEMGSGFARVMPVLFAAIVIVVLLIGAGIGWLVFS